MKYWLELLKKILLSPINLMFKVEEKFTYEKYKLEKQKRENIEKSLKQKEEQYVTQREKVHELQKRFDNTILQNKNLNKENKKLQLRNNELIKQNKKLQNDLEDFIGGDGIDED